MKVTVLESNNVTGSEFLYRLVFQDQISRTLQGNPNLF